MTKLIENKSPLIILTLLATASALFSAFVVSQNYWDDDAFISFRYAKNLFNGLGLVYNAGERVEGYTNFLWTIIAYFGMLLRFQPIYFAQAVSVAAQMLTLYMLYLLGIASSRPRVQALIAPAFLACNVSFLLYPMTGMETSFFTMLITLAVLLIHRQFYKSRGGAIVTGIVLLSISLTRFDGLGIVAAILVFKILLDREFKNMLPVLLVLAVGVGGYHIWRFFYYPTLLPNTFYAKVGFSVSQLVGGLKYVYRFAVENGQHALIFALIPFVAGHTSRTTKMIAWVVVAHLSYIVLVGGDWMPHFRFVLPVLPLLFWLMQEGLLAIYSLLKPKIQQLGSCRQFAILFFLLLFTFNLSPLYQNREFRGFSAPWFITGDARAIGEYLDSALPEDAAVAIEWGGILPFYMEQPVLDTFGLTDSEITRQDFPGSVFGRWITKDYLASRKPDVIIPCARIFNSSEEAHLSVDKTPVESINRKNSIYNYGFYASLANQNYGYRVCIIKIHENGYWPVLVRIGFENFCQKLELGEES